MSMILRTMLASVVLVALFGATLTASAATWSFPSAGGGASGSSQTAPFCQGNTCTYVALEPLGGPFSAPPNANPISYYLATMFRIVFSLGGMFAVTMLVVAGVGYMMSESGVNTSRAKERAVAALWGIALLASSWLILYVVNPKLLQFNLSGIGLGNVNLAPNSSTNTGPGAESGRGNVTILTAQEIQECQSRGGFINRNVNPPTCEFSN